MPAGDDPLDELLAGRYRDPETGELLGAAARSIVIDDSLAGREAELVAALDLGRRLAVVAVDGGVRHPVPRLGVRALELRDQVVERGHLRQ